jgi:hypothetical protein
MPILSKVQKGQPITAELFNNMIDAIRECQINSVVGSGGVTSTFKRGPSGTTISINGTAGGSTINVTYPFQYYASGSGFGLTAGTINGILPDNIGTTFGMSPNTEYFVNLECETDGKTVQTATIVADNSPPSPCVATPEIAPLSFALNLLYISENGNTYRTIGASPIAAITQEVIREAKTGVSYGELPYTSWYTWVFAS